MRQLPDAPVQNKRKQREENKRKIASIILHSPIHINLNRLDAVRPPGKPRLAPDRNHIADLQLSYKLAVACATSSALCLESFAPLGVSWDVVQVGPRNDMVLPLPEGCLIPLNLPLG